MASQETMTWTAVQLAEQILLGIRKIQQEIRENPITVLSTDLHMLVGEIETLCKEQVGKRSMAPQEERPVVIPGLTEGRMCHYVAYNNRHLAAIVIGYEESRADLAVFTNLANVNGMKNFGTQFQQDIEYSEEPRPGTWHWIEKA